MSARPTESIEAEPEGSVYVLDQRCERVRKIGPSAMQIATSISTAGIVNAATLTGGFVAQGELISIFGSNLGPAAVQSYTTVNNSIPTTLGVVQVLVNGAAAVTLSLPARSTLLCLITTLDPINVTILQGTPSGPASIAVNIGGVTAAQNVTVAVK